MVGEIGGQDFESDLAVEAGGFGEVNLSPATLSELLQDALMRDDPGNHHALLSYENA